MEFFSATQVTYILFCVTIVFAALWSYYKHPENNKRTTLGLLAVFSLFLILYSLNKGFELDSNIGINNIQAGSLQKPPAGSTTITSGGTKYTLLEPSAFNSLHVSEPTFSGNQNPYSALFSICTTILFVLLMGVWLWKLVQMHLDIHYRNPDEWKVLKKVQKPNGESK